MQIAMKNIVESRERFYVVVVDAPKSCAYCQQRGYGKFQPAPASKPILVDRVKDGWDT